MCVRLHGSTLRLRTRVGITVSCFGIKTAQREPVGKPVGTDGLRIT
jgi:hypothetical protein